MACSQKGSRVVLLGKPSNTKLPVFFIKFTKGGGGAFPFIKIYDGKFVHSGGLWQHEIGIEKVF